MRDRHSPKSPPKSLLLQAAAVSVCQYLASEVHKPLTPPQATPTPPSAAVASSGSSKPKSKRSHTSGTPSQPSAGKAAATSNKARAKSAPELPPPSPLVSQIMEMGFPRHHIEKAIEVDDFVERFQGEKWVT